MGWLRRKVFNVTLHLNGRHPYLKSAHLDYETRDATVRVTARSWNDAERQALKCVTGDWWTAHVKQISRLPPKSEVTGG